MITSCCLLSLLLLIPLLLWLMSGLTTSLPFDCEAGMVNAGMGSAETIQNMWSQAQKDYCCMTVGRGCATTAPPPPPPVVQPAPIVTQPPTPPPTPPPTRPAPPPPVVLPAPIQMPAPIVTPPPAPAGPVDPYNCAVGQYPGWQQVKQEWCCRIHHICDGQPTAPPAPADPYNCDAGFANWMVGWSVAKKSWCCANKGKGCPQAAG